MTDTHCYPSPSNPEEAKALQLEKSYGMSGSQNRVSYAHCNACNRDYSVAHAGVNDVKKHVATAKHKGSSKACLVIKTCQSSFKRILIKLQELKYCLLIL